jgi:hypothetical protein
VSEEPTGAQEWRIVTPAGVIRVYRPAGLHAPDAGIAVYVHGLYTNVDQAWIAHRLPEQFEASARNALFVAPAARTAAPDPLPWPDLAAVLAVVGEETGGLPRGPLVAAGHSGAYKQLASWLAHPRLGTLLLLDALYGMQAEFRAWLTRRSGHRMALVGRDTAAATAAWTRTLPGVVRRAHCPDDLQLLTARERAAKVLAMGTAADHFGIVTDGRILPLLLRWSGLPARP